MAVARVRTLHPAIGTSGTSITLGSIPTPAVGNLLWCIYGVTVVAGVTAMNMTPDAGAAWTVGQPLWQANTYSLQSWWKIADGTDPASIVFDIGATSNTRHEVVYLEYSGVDRAGPMGARSGRQNNAASVATASLGPLAPGWPGDSILAVLATAGNDTASGQVSWPSGYTSVYSSNLTNQRLAVAENLNKADDVSETAVPTWTTGSKWNGYLASIHGSSAAPLRGGLAQI